jgi:hypothetical protein
LELTNPFADLFACLLYAGLEGLENVRELSLLWLLPEPWGLDLGRGRGLCSRRRADSGRLSAH